MTAFQRPPQWLDLHFPAGPQSESKLQVPPGALAHLLDLHLAPPQSEWKLQLPPAAVAHLRDLHFTPAPQSESKLHEPWERVSGSGTRGDSRGRRC